MNYSVFEIIGPPMIGPSSSHTAGACRIGWAARELLGGTPDHAHIGLHGSFFATGKGHGTDLALVGGLLGFAPDDERLKDSHAFANSEGLHFEIGGIDLGPEAHPNSVELRVALGSTEMTLRAASIGGGSIILQQIDPFPVEIRGNLEALVIWHEDAPGFLCHVTGALACAELNVASIRTSRFERGSRALTAIEVDGSFPGDALSLIGRVRAIHRIARLPILPGF